MTVAITRSGRSTSELGEWQHTRKTGKARRMLAIALVLEGWSREAAAEACGQNFRGRVHRYNTDGLKGLFNQARRNGPSPRLSAKQSPSSQDRPSCRDVREGPGGTQSRTG
jgi:hypothetical protein